MELPDKEAIKARIKYLSDDGLRGRKPGTPGFQMAVDYVIDQLKQIGVEPKGDDGYFQKVVLRTGKIDTTKVSLLWNGTPLAMRKEAVVMPDMNRAENSGEGEVVFVGLGISAKHLNHDDYEGIDVKGKVVLIMSGVPEKFPASERAHFNSLAIRAEVAASKGAIGAIAVMGTDATYKTSVEAAAKGTRGVVNKNGSTQASRIATHPNLKFYVVAHASFFKSKVEELKNGDAVGRISVTSATTYTDLISHNVVGWIPGTDPTLKNEFIVHSAHLDHKIGRAHV